MKTKPGGENHAITLCTLLPNISQFTQLYNLILYANRNFFDDANDFYAMHVPTMFEMLHRATGVRLLNDSALTRFRPLTADCMRMHLKNKHQIVNVTDNELLDFFSKNVSFEIQVHDKDASSFGMVWRVVASAGAPMRSRQVSPLEETETLLEAAFRATSDDAEAPPRYLYLATPAKTRSGFAQVCGFIYEPTASGTTHTVHVVLHRDSPTACMAMHPVRDRLVCLGDDETKKVVDAAPILNDHTASFHATRQFLSRTTSAKRPHMPPVRADGHVLHSRIVGAMRPISRCEAVTDAVGRSIATIGIM